MWRKFIFAVPIVLLLACERAEEYRPTGRENEVVFICDGFPDHIFTLDSLINDTFFTPQETPLFRITPITYEQFITYMNYKNIVILSYPDSPNHEFYSRVFPSTGVGVYIRKNVFTERDLVFGVYSESKDSVLKLLNYYAPVLKQRIFENYISFLKEKEYFLGYDKKLTKKLFKEHGFTFELSPGWVYINHDENFFTLYKHYPDRFIYCYTAASEKPLDANAFMHIRDSLGQIYYDGDQILRSSIRVDTIGINGVPAIVIVGAWQNDKNTTGGGLINISFNKDGCFYMFDYGIYNPDVQDKIEYILRGYLIFKTVKFKNDGHSKNP